MKMFSMLLLVASDCWPFVKYVWKEKKYIFFLLYFIYLCKTGANDLDYCQEVYWMQVSGCI